jgi:tetrahydromethanopterin S-methyltransferase subunit D
MEFFSTVLVAAFFAMGALVSDRVLRSFAMGGAFSLPSFQKLLTAIARTRSIQHYFL